MADEQRIRANLLNPSSKLVYFIASTQDVTVSETSSSLWLTKFG